MSYNLFLDDIRMPKQAFSYTNRLDYILKNWAIVRNYDQFIDMVECKGLPDLVSFDHDLSDVHYKLYNEKVPIDYDDNNLEKTGYHCTKWLVDYCIDNEKEFPNYMVHSMNPVGAENIIRYIENYKKVWTK